MRYQRLAFALLTGGISPLLLLSSGGAQEPDAPPPAREAAVEGSRAEADDGGERRSEGSLRRGPLALTGNEAAVEWILPTQKSIIALAELAKENAQSAEVRSFAETLYTEHTEFVKQLNASIEEDANRRRQEREERRKRRLENREERSERRGDRDSADEDQDQDQEAEETRVVLDRLGDRAEKIIERAEAALGDVVEDAATRAARRLRAAARGFPWIQTKQQTAENALTMAKEDLQARQGVDSDQVYLGYTSAQHVQAIAELNAVASQTSAETKQLIENTLAQMQRHRLTASQLMRQLAAKER